MIDPENLEEISQEELFKKYLDQTTTRLKDLDLSTEQGQLTLDRWIKQVESQVFVTRTIGAALTRARREQDEKSGKNRWDKETRGLNKSNGSISGGLKSKAKKPKKSDLEKVVEGFIQLEDEEETLEERNQDIVKKLSGKKYTEDEVRTAISYARKSFVFSEKVEEE